MSYSFLLCLSVLICTVAFSGPAFAAAIEGGVDPARVSEIAAMLGEKPFAFGPAISDRVAWEKLAKHDAFKGLPETAERKISEPMPQMTEEIYSSYARTGQRTKQYAEDARRAGLPPGPLHPRRVHRKQRPLHPRT